MQKTCTSRFCAGEYRQMRRQQMAQTEIFWPRHGARYVRASRKSQPYIQEFEIGERAKALAEAWDDENPPVRR